MTYATILARRIPGPCLPGTVPAGAQHLASHYLHFRKGRQMPAGKALEAALRLPAAYVKGKGYYGSWGGGGAVWEAHGDKLRWIESTADSGLRFVGWADDLPGGPSHFGWHCEDDGDGDSLRGGVWQLPGRKGKARFLYGFAEMESRDREMNPGSAAICVSTISEADRTGPDACASDADESDELRDAVRWADGLAEAEAEDRRDYNRAYRAGREAAERDGEAIEARRELLPLLAELRAVRRSAVAGEVPTICRTLRASVDSLLETISEKREERDSAWADVWGESAKAWAAGFMDESAGGFVRAVRLGYAKATDWAGPADKNPCNREAVA